MNTVFLIEKRFLIMTHVAILEYRSSLRCIINISFDHLIDFTVTHITVASDFVVCVSCCDYMFLLVSYRYIVLCSWYMVCSPIPSHVTREHSSSPGNADLWEIPGASCRISRGLLPCIPKYGEIFCHSTLHKTSNGILVSLVYIGNTP